MSGIFSGLCFIVFVDVFIASCIAFVNISILLSNLCSVFSVLVMVRFSRIYFLYLSQFVPNLLSFCFAWIYFYFAFAVKCTYFVCGLLC